MGPLSAGATESLKAYTGSAYRAINAHLRGGKPIDDENRRHMDTLDAVLDEARTTESQVVYRGLGSLAVQQLFGADLAAKKGQILVDKGFLSTSSSEAVARQFVNINPAKNVLLAIKVPVGSKALDVSKYSDMPEEKETLIARDARLKVVKFDKKSRRLEVEMLPHEGKKAGDEKVVPQAADSTTSDHEDKFGYVDASGLSLVDGDEAGETFDLS